MHPTPSPTQPALGRYKRFHYLPLLLLTLVLLICCGIIFHSLQTDLTEQLSFHVSHDGQTDTIALWEAETEESEEGQSAYYLFLPSYAALSDVTLETASGKAVTIGGQTLQNGQSLSGLNEQETYALRYGSAAGSLTILRSSAVTALFIDTRGDCLEKVNADKANTADVNVTVCSPEGTVLYQSDSDYSGRFHGRGNSTWHCEKKPYRLNLPDSADLLGSGASQKWVLLANAYDETQMRNKLVYDFADQLGTLWAPASQYVDLYVDDQYQGLYLLSEAVEVSETRLNIPEEDIFFLANYENHWDSDSIGFYTVGGKCIQLVDSMDPTEEKAALLEEKLNALEQRIADRDASLADTIDFDSWADLYLLHEVFLNGELEQNSSYFYWDIAGDERIYAAIVWDFDFSLGNYNPFWTESGDSTKLLASDELYPWFSGLLEVEAFREKVISRYEDTFRPLLLRWIDRDMAQLEDTIDRARAMDDIRWEGKLDKVAQDSAAETDRMQEFMEDRICFLDQYWLGTNTTDAVRAENETGDKAPEETDPIASEQDTESTSSQADTQVSAGSRIRQLVRTVLRKYGKILGVLGLFGLTGMLLLWIDWQRGRKPGR